MEEVTVDESEPEPEADQEPVAEPAPDVPAEVAEPVAEASAEGEPAVQEKEPEPVVPVADEKTHEGDLYTDYSPEAVVRRAAWNKGLRCRRDYGDHNIPVAFVKGKVAVFVQSADADRSIDDVLRDEGWTVLRYDEAVITDGLEQGEEIAEAVKANLREAKAAAKKKRKSAKK